MINYTIELLRIPKLRISVLLLSAFIAFSGCKKDEAAAPKSSNIMFVHAIADASPMDIFIDKKSTFTNIPYGSASPYAETTAGSHRVTAMETGTIVEKVNTSHSFGGDKKYSIIAFNTNNQPQSILVEDTVATPGIGKFWIRYINLSPPNNNTSYVIRLEGSTQIFEFGARDFKGTSNYREYDAGSYSFNVVNIKSTNANAVASTGASEFQGGRIYTLVLTGTETSAAPMNLTLKAVANP